MASHLWNNRSRLTEPLRSIARGPGQPALQWTESRDRKLYRLIAQACVPTNGIATAMYEPAVPAEPGRPEQPAFAPCRSSCLNRWKDLTGIKPREMQIGSLFGRKKHRERMLRAFEAYQEHQRKTDQAIESRRLSIAPPIPKISSETYTSARSDMPTPALTFEGTTPADYGPSILTPLAQDTLQLHIVDETQKSSVEQSAFAEVEIDGISQNIKLDGIVSSKILASTEQHLDTVPEQTVPAGGKNVPGPEELAKLEDDMGVPHGFLDWVKYSLTRSRISIQSVISARRSSRNSSHDPSAEAKATQASNSNAPLQSQSQLATAQAVDDVQLQVDRPDPDIFLELRKDGASDSQVAAQLSRLLENCSTETARQIVRSRNKCNETALEVALALGNIPACRILLAFGADSKADTADGNSLSNFGRAAQKKPGITSQRYYAIGACRNIILDHSYELEKGQNSNRSYKSKKRANVNSDAEIKVKRRAQNWATGRDEADTIATTLSNSQDEGHQTYAYYQPYNHPGTTHRRDSGMTSNRPTTQRATSSRVPVLVDFFNQQTQTSSVAGSSQVDLSNVQSYSLDSTHIMPALPEFDPRLGQWEVLSDNRTAFVLYPRNPAANSSPPQVATTQALSLEKTNNAPFPEPIAQDLPSSNHRRQYDARRNGIIIDQSGNILSSVSSSSNLHFHDFRKESATNNQLSVSLPSPIFHNPEGYSSQDNTLANGGEPQLATDIAVPQDPVVSIPGYMSVPEAELDALFSNRNFDSSHVDDWDWQRPVPFGSL